MLMRWILMGALLAAPAAQSAVLMQFDRGHAAAGETVRLQGLFVNDEGSSSRWEMPPRLTVWWRLPDGRTLASEARLEGSPLALEIPAGQFARARWATVVPEGAAGLLSVAVEGHATLLALDATPTEAGSPVAPPAMASGLRAPVQEVPGTVPATLDEGTLARFRSALAAHEPVYFSVGSRNGDTSARFQISMKYRFFQPADSQESGFRDRLWLGFTQTSLWDLSGESKPFRDNSYRPSLFWQNERAWLSADQRFRVGLSAGYEHESNGKDGLASRSIDTLFAHPVLGWRTGAGTLSLGLKARHYLDKQDNPDITSYRGHADWILRWAQDDGLMVSALWRAGTQGRGSTQLDAALPLRNEWLGNLNGFLHVQYFRGYGETLLDYNLRRAPQWRVGLMVVR